MNREHLGDGYDFFKRAMLDVLRTSRPTLKIMPMFSDRGWKDSEICIYKSLLGARAHEDVKRESFDGGSEYFEKRQMCDLFLDPDTGLKINKERNPRNKNKKSSNKRRESRKKGPGARQYLRSSELEKLLNATNVLAVYQHAPREPPEWLKRKLRDLREDLRKNGIKSVGYEAGRVGMIFFTKNGKRSKEIKQELGKLVGQHSKRVVSMPRLRG
jgi:hypothetical protein